MSMRPSGAALILVGIVVLGVAIVFLSRPPAPAPVAAAHPEGGPSQARSPAGPDGSSEGAAQKTSPPADGTPAVTPAESDDDPDFESALRWSLVDLDAVREALPDNLYWDMSVPTDDPEVQSWRDDERARWNREYGKVLSGTASDEEIADYFDLRRRISEDAVEFSAFLTTSYGDILPERDLGLLALATRLHLARLEEMPRRMAEAYERKEQQDRLREAWLADEEAFGASSDDSEARD